MLLSKYLQLLHQCWYRDALICQQLSIVFKLHHILICQNKLRLLLYGKFIIDKAVVELIALLGLIDVLCELILVLDESIGVVARHLC